MDPELLHRQVNGAKKGVSDADVNGTSNGHTAMGLSQSMIIVDGIAAAA